MKKLIKYPVLLAFILLFTGCPYEALFPLGDATEKYPQYIIGNWISESDLDTDNPMYYEIADVDGNNFNLFEYSFDSDIDDYYYTLYNCHMTTIGNDYFMNIYDGSMDAYYFYRIVKLDNGNIRIDPVSEYIKEDFTSSEEMKAYFAKYKDLSFFYGDSETMVPYN